MEAVASDKKECPRRRAAEINITVEIIQTPITPDREESRRDALASLVAILLRD